MILRNEIVDQLERYLSFFPEEVKRLEDLGNQLDQKGEDISYTSRKNMRGHLTASALVVDHDKNICLIFHNANKQYQQPGGHIDEGDQSIVSAAMRETKEETGLDVHVMPWCAEHKSPIDIETHAIAPRPEKEEGEHVHHDFIYLFEVHETNTSLQEDEISELHWVTLDEFAAVMPRFVRIAERIRLHGILG